MLPISTFPFNTARIIFLKSNNLTLLQLCSKALSGFANTGRTLFRLLSLIQGIFQNWIPICLSRFFCTILPTIQTPTKIALDFVSLNFSLDRFPSILFKSCLHLKAQCKDLNLSPIFPFCIWKLTTPCAFPSSLNCFYLTFWLFTNITYVSN